MKLPQRLRSYAHKLLDQCTATRSKRIKLLRGDVILTSLALENAAERIDELETALRLVNPGVLAELDRKKTAA